jgi:methylmalonyl-CoA mutase
LLGDDGVKVEPWPQPPGFTASKQPAVSVKPLKPLRLGEAFEALRDAADAHDGFEVFIASMGEIIDHNVRTTWTQNYLAAGGIKALVSDGYKTPEEAANAFKASGAKAACICSSDAINSALAEPTAKALKSTGAKLVLMAGKAGEREEALKKAGVDQFLFAGADAIATLRGLQEKLA